MRFDDFFKERKVVRCRPDKEWAKALLKMSDASLDAANALDTERNSSAALTLAYTALRQVLEAICLLRGYKVYSHEAYTSFLKELDEPAAAESFNRFRKLRNGVEYYARPVSAAVAHQALKGITTIRKRLREKYAK